MPRKPVVSTLNANSVGILNTIRDNASPDYRQAVPAAEETTESIRMVGAAIMGFEPRRNEFINALVNRIAMVLITSRSYSNPLATFKRGYIELGETVEEIFIELAKGYQFDPAEAENTVFRRQIPDVKTMFHSMNFQKFYKVTVSNDQLRQAFLSWDGVTDMVTRIVNSLYSGMYYDEYLMTKYMIAIMAITGNMASVQIDDFAVAANADKIVTAIKTVSNNMEFMRNDYNIAGVNNFCEKSNQHLIQSSNFSANIDVNSLAKAFNLEYVEFMGKTNSVDSFSFTSGEQARISELLADDPSFNPNVFNESNLELYSQIGAILVDRDFFMIFDNLQEATSIYNAQGLYYNQFLHVWKTFSASPFANAVIFTTGTNSVTAVTVTPATATVAKGKSIQAIAEVSGTGFYNEGVVWRMDSTATDSTVSSSGLIKIGKNETKTSLTITATSSQDSSKSDTCVITVTA